MNNREVGRWEPRGAWAPIFRTTITSAFFTMAQSMYVSVVLDTVGTSAPSAQYLTVCCISVTPEAMHMGPMKGTVAA